MFLYLFFCFNLKINKKGKGKSNGINKKKKGRRMGGRMKSHLGFGADVEEISLFIATNKSIKIPNLDCSFFFISSSFFTFVSFLFYFQIFNGNLIEIFAQCLEY